MKGRCAISQYGIKIKNISAGMLYDVNLGTRDYFTYTDAMHEEEGKLTEEQKATILNMVKAFTKSNNQ